MCTIMLFLQSNLFSIFAGIVCVQCHFDLGNIGLHVAFVKIHKKCFQSRSTDIMAFQFQTSYNICLARHGHCPLFWYVSWYLRSMAMQSLEWCHCQTIALDTVYTVGISIILSQFDDQTVFISNSNYAGMGLGKIRCLHI